MPVAEFDFSQVAGLKPAILVKVNSFKGIFSGFCLPLGKQILRNTEVAASVITLVIIFSKR